MEQKDLNIKNISIFEKYSMLPDHRYLCDRKGRSLLYTKLLDSSNQAPPSVNSLTLVQVLFINSEFSFNYDYSRRF